MLRVCGAQAERDALSRARCWCGGLFCGRGGAKETAAFRRVFHTSATAASVSEFLNLIRQADLFDGDLYRLKYLTRFERLGGPRLVARPRHTGAAARRGEQDA